jgi:hypothetical protein
MHSSKWFNKMTNSQIQFIKKWFFWSPITIHSWPTVFPSSFLVSRTFLASHFLPLIFFLSPTHCQRLNRKRHKCFKRIKFHRITITTFSFTVHSSCLPSPRLLLSSSLLWFSLHSLLLLLIFIHRKAPNFKAKIAKYWNSLRPYREVWSSR